MYAKVSPFLKMNTSFARQKNEILSNLYNNIDFSPKGSVDAPVVDLGRSSNAIYIYMYTIDVLIPLCFFN